MDEAKREELLDRVTSDTATVGAEIPDTIQVHGRELDLGEFLVETRKVDRISSEAEETLEAAKQTLREERRRRMERLESDPLDVGAAERLADEIIGIDRALNALESIRHPEYGETARSADVEDYKRWVGFLDDIQG